MSESVLLPGRDYYVENGLFVFTAEYLRRRGSCCRSGCRHCPFGFKAEERKEPMEEGKNSDS
jgi:hypothetical protein